VHLMRGIGPHPYGATLPPRALSPAANQERLAERHEQLDAVMAVRCGRETWAPHDHHLGPGCHVPAGTQQHDRLLSSRRPADKLASLFKTRQISLTRMSHSKRR